MHACMLHEMGQQAKIRKLLSNVCWQSLKTSSPNLNASEISELILDEILENLAKNAL